MNKFLILGLGTFGTATALGLMEEGAEVFAVDHHPELVEAIKDRVTEAAILEATSEEALGSIGIRDFDCAVVCMANLEASVLATLILKKLGIPRLIARASDDAHAQILERIGASQVLQPEKEEAERLVKRLTASHVLSYVTLADDHVLANIKATDAIIGRTIKELDFRARFKVNIIAIKVLVPEISADGTSGFKYEVNDVPEPDAVISEGDVLVFVGKTRNIEALKADLDTERGNV